MAKKSKTQRAKASAARKQRKAAREQEMLAAENDQEEAVSDEEASSKKTRSKKSSEEIVSTETSAKSTKKVEAQKPKKSRFQFFRDVRSEMHRVTWPSRTEVLRWTGVVVVALLFFGIFVALLDNVIITPLLYLISGLGA